MDQLYKMGGFRLLDPIYLYSKSFFRIWGCMVSHVQLYNMSNEH